MAKGIHRALGRITASEASVAVRHGHVTPLFQPIEALQTGACRGFEALARLSYEGRLMSPDTFLGSLSPDDRLCLFGEMLGASIALLKSNPNAFGALYISINVEVSLLVSDEFIDILQYFLERYDFRGERLVLEILENEEVADFSRLLETLAAVRRLGLSIALDDIGSGYASLTKLRDLPIDILKLDRSFSRDLEMHPEDLMFVQSILSLADGLGKRMIVEGIETPEVYDALRVIGVEFGQGFEIAPPMRAGDVETWLAGRPLREPSQSPLCLLGAYASHLTVVEACRVLRRQPLPMTWSEEAGNPEACVIGRLFKARGWHDTAFGKAQKDFHKVLTLFDKDEARWLASADVFRDAMAEAISARPHEMRCEPATTPRPAPRKTSAPATKTVAVPKPVPAKSRAALG